MDLITLTILFFSILSGLLGCFMLWGRVSNYFDSFAHSSIFAFFIASIVGVSSALITPLFAIVFSTSIWALGLMGLQVNNSLLLIISSVFIALSSLKSVNSRHHCSEHDHHGSVENSELGAHINIESLFLGGNTDAFNNKWMIWALGGLIVGSLCLLKTWVLMLVNGQTSPRLWKHKILELAQLLILSFFASIGINLTGVLLLIASSIFPALIASKISNGPYRMIVISIVISVLSNLFCLYLAYLMNIKIVALSVILQFMLLCGFSLAKRVF